ncbi:hypothetical protein ACIBEK_22460 [Nocardia fusca]|uniref:Uncharacterized protein n=1 Tax=Nocardia fusca TaxID=941183 RepID=A0ABV3FCU0_9NOCA
MRKQHGTYPVRTDQQRFVARPVPPRVLATRTGGPRSSRRGAR